MPGGEGPGNAARGHRVVPQLLPGTLCNERFCQSKHSDFLASSFAFSVPPLCVVVKPSGVIRRSGEARHAQRVGVQRINEVTMSDGRGPVELAAGRCQRIAALNEFTSYGQLRPRISPREVPLCWQLKVRYFIPDLESLRAFLPVRRHAQLMPSRAEMLAHQPQGRQEPLGVTGRFEALQDPVLPTYSIRLVYNIVRRYQACVPPGRRPLCLHDLVH